MSTDLPPGYKIEPRVTPSGLRYLGFSPWRPKTGRRLVARGAVRAEVVSALMRDHQDVIDADSDRRANGWTLASDAAPAATPEGGEDRG